MSAAPDKESTLQLLRDIYMLLSKVPLPAGTDRKKLLDNLDAAGLYIKRELK